MFPGGRPLQRRDGSLHATHSYNLKTIKHVTFNESWLRQAAAGE
jgi:predicted neuraminidase